MMKIRNERQDLSWSLAVQGVGDWLVAGRRGDAIRVAVLWRVAVRRGVCGRPRLQQRWLLVLRIVRDAVLCRRSLRGVRLRGGQMRRLHIHIRLCLVHASSSDSDSDTNACSDTYTDADAHAHTHAVCSRDGGRALGLAAGLGVAREANGRVLLGGGSGRRG